MPIDRRLDAERRMLGLIAGAGLPPPDEVDHEPGAVIFVWHDTKTVVCVDLEDKAGAEAGRPGVGGPAAADGA